MAGAHEVRVVGFHGVSLGPLSSRFAHDVMLLIAAGACLWRGVAVRVERTAWLLIGVGVLGWTFGELYYTVVLWDESAPPIPSPADLGYLTFPVFTFAGMVVLLRDRVKFTPALLVDGIATALAVAALSAAIVFQTALEHASGAPAAVATSLAYPLTDLFLLAVGVGALAGTGWRLDRTWGLLAGGILLFWFADSMYLVQRRPGHLRGRRLVRRRLVGRAAADRRRRLAAAACAPHPLRRRLACGCSPLRSSRARSRSSCSSTARWGTSTRSPSASPPPR